MSIIDTPADALLVTRSIAFSKILPKVSAGATLLNIVKDKTGADSDLALSRFLSMSAPTISKIRSGKFPIGASTVIRIHEATGMSIEEIKSALS